MKKHSIQIENLSKQFTDFELNKVTFSVPSGCIVGFIGENGSGKSTTIKLILNQLKCDDGKIFLKGIKNTDYHIKQDIGVAFDEFCFHSIFTVKDVDSILKRVYKSWDSDLYYSYIKRFKLPKNKTFDSFSKGMKMKLSIICALAHNPKLLILDEATSGLDPVARDEMLDLFLDFIQDEEHSIFFSSHITSDIQKIADYVVLIHEGKIVFFEKKDDLIYNYGVIKGKKSDFSKISSHHYISYKENPLNIEFLVKDRALAKQQYKNFIVDAITLEELMLFFIKGGKNERIDY